jgi:hypothetical protein
MMTIAAAAVSLTTGACTLPATAAAEHVYGLPRLPIIGGSSDLTTNAVRSIKTLQVRRIAVMPLVEAPDKIDNVVADGAGEAVTAELFSEMSLVGGWEIVPDVDVAAAMQKLPPGNPGNLDANAIALGRSVSAEAVLYGTVERYKERVGVDYAAASPAAVTFTLHLIDVKSKEVVWNAKFAKTQKALSENLMNLGNFIYNSGRWVRAHEIAMEGVKYAVTDLRSQLALDQNIKHFETGSYEEIKQGAHRYQGGEVGTGP